ncbi:hypothetical protein SKAU_G00171270 [Synaphobranchus kaupii]|uniref:Uncharacterized protein n=1 Tax=Synaphobranchus kaupii TaxID=118154 RepID=A0A9Q1J0V9_SYNKA|nr:hypothetical protein SKAU_G00171270 [Synaphobranchus kaupii]
MLGFRQRTWHVPNSTPLPQLQTEVLTHYSQLTDLQFLRGPSAGLVAARVQRFETEALQLSPKSVSNASSPTSPCTKETAGKGKRKSQTDTARVMRLKVANTRNEGSFQPSGANCSVP